MSYFVQIGPAAVRVRKLWIGVASGNRHCCVLRAKPEAALRDAKKLALSLPAGTGD